MSDNIKHDLLANFNKIQTTKLGVLRIRKNLNLSNDIDVVNWCKERIKSSTNIEKRGKNWYVQVDGIIITVNASSYTIITAHKTKS